MDAPLWTETHAPDVTELPQPTVREYLERASEEPINLVLHGPVGVGKTAAVKALAREAHGGADAGASGGDADTDGDEDRDGASATGHGAGAVEDLTVINVADFFDRTKKEIRNDPRFEHFLTGRSALSKRDMINHVLKESASYAPVSGTYRTILLDNAEAIREDFQQALRRVMEQYAANTQFVICTRQPSKLIPPIESRCFPVPVRAPTETETTTVLERILEREAVEYDDLGLGVVAAYADGNLRKAILSAQTVAESEGAVTTETVDTLGEVGHDDTVEGMLAAAESGEFESARKTLDSLLNDDGLGGDEVLVELLAAGRDRHEGDERAQARLHRLAGEVDVDLNEGSSPRVHLSRLLAELGREA